MCYFQYPISEQKQNRKRERGREIPRKERERNREKKREKRGEREEDTMTFINAKQGMLGREENDNSCRERRKQKYGISCHLTSIATVAIILQPFNLNVELEGCVHLSFTEVACCDEID